MSICSRCLRSFNALFLKSFKGGNLKIEPCRKLFNKPKKPKTFNSELKKTDIKFTGPNDPRFSELLFKSWNDWNVHKEGFRKFCGEFKLFYEELIDNHRKVWNERLDWTEGRIDMLCKFQTEEDIKRFSVATDKDFNSGYSSASLSLTDRKTGLFSGNISLEPSKTEAITRPGFANMNSHRQYYSFYREKLLDLSEYTHLVFKIRGDGRMYSVLLRTATELSEINNKVYKYPLYTRGGPYWQIAKLPLQYFFLTRQGMMYQQHDCVSAVPFTGIGITVALIEGPFKLEIDYIGLEFQKYGKQITPYEQYKK